MVQRFGEVRSKARAYQVNYLEVFRFLFRLNYYVFLNVKGGDMSKVRSMSELLKDVIKKQTASRDLQKKTIKKQDSTEKDAQIKR